MSQKTAIKSNSPSFSLRPNTFCASTDSPQIFASGANGKNHLFPRKYCITAARGIPTLPFHHLPFVVVLRPWLVLGPWDDETNRWNRPHHAESTQQIEIILSRNANSFNAADPGPTASCPILPPWVWLVVRNNSEINSNIHCTLTTWIKRVSFLFEREQLKINFLFFI